MIATNEELALLEKWKRKLCLQEWRIKLLTHLHPEEMMVRNTTGCTEWSQHRPRATLNGWRRSAATLRSVEWLTNSPVKR